MVKRKNKQRGTSSRQLIYMCRTIKNFRGIFMRDNLPKKPRKYECAIINLDVAAGSGSHWVAYRKVLRNVIYFNSFGNLKPPPELINYWGKHCNIKYIRTRLQKYSESDCGQWCVAFLRSTQ